jgi:predicted GH43/DUF377 family glycosyl hydrolase
MIKVLTVFIGYVCVLASDSVFGSTVSSDWQFGPFQRIDGANPVIVPCVDSSFYCPLQNKEVHWEVAYTFNPAAVVRKGKVYLIYRAEDEYGMGIGKRISRLGLAESSDGIHFQRSGTPIIFPARDDQSAYEFPGGCEDPRIVETEEGSYVMTYTQWNRQMAVLAIATSDDLLHWKKRGFAFAKTSPRFRSKSGSIICRREGDRLIATKIQGKYWMYWGEKNVHVATSDDLISWDPVQEESGEFLIVFEPRNGSFDSTLVEAGPPALLTEKGILLLYNGKNSATHGVRHVMSGAYSAGQILLDPSNPTKVLDRSESYFLAPRRPYEISGQYKEGTVFIEGLVHFHNKWFLYYGAADSVIGVAVTPSQ